MKYRFNGKNPGAMLERQQQLVPIRSGKKPIQLLGELIEKNMEKRCVFCGVQYKNHPPGWGSCQNPKVKKRCRS